MKDNYNAVNNGFNILLPSVAEFVCKNVVNAYGGTIWWKEILNRLDDSNLPVSGSYATLVGSLDLQACFKIIDRFWNDAFRTYNINLRTWAKELMGARNKVAHIGAIDISRDDAERYLDTMVRFARIFNSKCADDISVIYKTVREASYPEQTTIVETVYKTVEEPTSIDIPVETTDVKLPPRSEIDLTKLIGTDIVMKTSLTKKITFARVTKAYPVYKVRLDALYYNDQNDRISTWITQYSMENGKTVQELSESDYNDAIENFIYESNPEKLQDTQKNISIFGQREPGVTLSDGRIVDGNRRFTCLRRLQKASSSPLYFETVILDSEATNDKKHIKLLELAVQHGEEKKVDYDLIDYAVGTYNDVVKTKLLTIQEYAENTNEKESDVKKRIEVAKVIAEFLQYVRLPEAYHVAREYQIYSLFEEMMAPLGKVGDGDKHKLKTIAFNNILTRAIPDQRKFIRDIKKLISSDSYIEFFDEQMQISAKIHEKFDSTEIKSKRDLDAFATDNTEFAEELRNLMNNTLLKERNKELKAKPGESISQSISLVEGIDKATVDRLSDDEKSHLMKQISDLSSKVAEYKEIVGGESDESVPAKTESNTQTDNSSLVFKVTPLSALNTFAVCTSADNTIANQKVSLDFLGVSMGSVSVTTSYCAYFIDGDGRIASNVEIFKAEKDSKVTCEFIIQDEIKDARLVVQLEDAEYDEVVMLIPFSKC